MTKGSIWLDWSVIDSLLPQGWRELALEMKLIKPKLPKHMNAKVTDIADVLRLFFSGVPPTWGAVLVAVDFDFDVVVNFDGDDDVDLDAATLTLRSS